MKNKIIAEKYYTLKDIPGKLWEKDMSLPLFMRYNFLKMVELSGINSIIPIYIRFYNQHIEIGRANLYIVAADIGLPDWIVPPKKQ